MKASSMRDGKDKSGSEYFISGEHLVAMQNVSGLLIAC
jgi:hypothetical protein